MSSKVSLQSMDHLLIQHVSNTASDLISKYWASPCPRCPQQRRQEDSDDIATLEEFITSLAQSAQIPAVLLISALVYIRRFVSHRHITDICQESFQVIFLAALLIAIKFLYDDPPSRSKSIFKHSRISKADLLAVERLLIAALRWMLALTEANLNDEFKRFEISTGIGTDNINRAYWRLFKDISGKALTESSVEESEHVGTSWITELAQTLWRKR